MTIKQAEEKLQELYQCTSQSGAVRRIRNLREKLYDMPRSEKVNELLDKVDKEAEFWMPYA